MRMDKIAEVHIRDLDKMTKKEVRRLSGWLRTSAKTLESLTAKDQPWLVRRKDYAPNFRFSLMK